MFVGSETLNRGEKRPLYFTFTAEEGETLDLSAGTWRLLDSGEEAVTGRSGVPGFDDPAANSVRVWVFLDTRELAGPIVALAADLYILEVTVPAAGSGEADGRVYVQRLWVRVD